MQKETNIEPITFSEIELLKTNLKKFDLKWFTLLADQIEACENNERFGDFSREKMRRVFSGLIKDPAWLTFVYSQGNILLRTLENNVEEARKQASV